MCYGPEFIAKALRDWIAAVGAGLQLASTALASGDFGAAAFFDCSVEDGTRTQSKDPEENGGQSGNHGDADASASPFNAIGSSELICSATL
jgi:hypothetical protein